MQAIEKEPEVLKYEIVDDEGESRRFDINLRIFVDSASRTIGPNDRHARGC